MFTPSMPRDRVETLRTGWSKALDRARAWESPDSSEAAPQGADVSTNATSNAPVGEESPAAS